ncbi:MAG: hypothetical protein HYR56_16605 [Acidobacteria bacterium]|nr:hypothetical protein [Acidobacteriota bacterium]MBI3423371.1 hypothetical protein [Acidobacteriota bacterium]
MRWLREYRREYIHQWVALNGKEFIADRTSFREAFAVIEAANTNRPFVIFVEDPNGSIRVTTDF